VKIQLSLTGRLSVSQPITNRLHYSHRDFNKTTKNRASGGYSRSELTLSLSLSLSAPGALKGSGSLSKKEYEPMHYSKFY
jgi:hypothetical protein